MANETPFHHYVEIGDTPSQSLDLEGYGSCFLVVFCLVFFLVFFILLILSFIFGWYYLKWISLFSALIILVLAIYNFLKFFGIKDDSELNEKKEINILDSPRLGEAQRAKIFLGFDFGNDFRLRTTGSHDYSEILLDFTDESFIPLMEYCKKLEIKKERIESIDEIIITEFLPYIKVFDETIISFGSEWLYRKDQNGNLHKISEDDIKKDGFTKVESHYDSKLSCDDDLFIIYQLTLEVDYKSKTLKMFYGGW